MKEKNEMVGGNMVVIGLVIGLIAFIAPIAILILILIISAFIKRNNKDDKGNFEETIRGMYIYIILIITLVVIISGIISIFKIGLDIILPEETQSQYSYEKQEKNENIINLTTTLSLVVTSIPIFIYHNKLAKKIKEVKTDEYYIEEIK